MNFEDFLKEKYDVDHMSGARRSLADTQKEYPFTVRTIPKGKPSQSVKVMATSKNAAINKAHDIFTAKGLRPRIDYDGLTT